MSLISKRYILETNGVRREVLPSDYQSAAAMVGVLPRDTGTIREFVGKGSDFLGQPAIIKGRIEAAELSERQIRLQQYKEARHAGI